MFWMKSMMPPTPSSSAGSATAFFEGAGNPFGSGIDLSWTNRDRVTWHGGLLRFARDSTITTTPPISILQLRRPRLTTSFDLSFASFLHSKLLRHTHSKSHVSDQQSKLGLWTQLLTSNRCFTEKTDCKLDPLAQLYTRQQLCKHLVAMLVYSLHEKQHC